MRSCTFSSRSVAAVVALLSIGILAGCPLPGSSANWVTKAGGEGSDRSYGIDVLTDGTSLITGYFTGDAQFCGCPDERGDVSTGGRNAFVGKWGADGNLAWVRNSSGDSVAIGNGVCELSDGSIALTGSFTDSVTFGETAAKAVTLTASGDMDIFVAKYSAAGEFQWAVRGGGSSPDAGMGIAPLAGGGMVLTGYVSGPTTFSSAPVGSSDVSVPAGPGGTDSVVVVYTTSGNVGAIRVDGGPTDDAGTAISAYADGSFAVTGYFGGAATFSPLAITAAGGHDVFVAKFSQGFAAEWVARAGGTGVDLGEDIQVTGDSCVVAGMFSDAATFTDAVSKATVGLTSAGGTDAFLAKYDANGDVQWVKQAGGEEDDVAHSVDVSDDGSVYLSGSFQDLAAFDPGAFTEQHRLAKGQDDTFVAGLTADGALRWVRAEGGTASDIAYAVGALAEGEGCIATGRFRERAYFGPNPANRTAMNSLGFCDFFVAQYLN
ncbi:MAG: hypothetical protein GY851_22200 [bacterium]|nr:hypothetical protein [bacterium]